MNKLDRRLNFPTDVELKEKFRQSAAVKAALEKPVDIQYLSMLVVKEVYGDFDKTDFDNISSAAPFFAHKQRILRKILDEEDKEGS